MKERCTGDYNAIKTMGGERARSEPQSEGTMVTLNATDPNLPVDAIIGCCWIHATVAHVRSPRRAAHCGAIRAAPIDGYGNAPEWMVEDKPINERSRRASFKLHAGSDGPDLLSPLTAGRPATPSAAEQRATQPLADGGLGRRGGRNLHVSPARWVDQSAPAFAKGHSTTVSDSNTRTVLKNLGQLSVWIARLPMAGESWKQLEARPNALANAALQTLGQLLHQLAP